MATTIAVTTETSEFHRKVHLLACPAEGPETSDLWVAAEHALLQSLAAINGLKQHSESGIFAASAIVVKLLGNCQNVEEEICMPVVAVGFLVIGCHITTVLVTCSLAVVLLVLHR